MVRLLLQLALFLLSLLVIFRAPTNFLWYLSILVTEFSVVFILPVLLLIFWPARSGRFYPLQVSVGVATIAVLLIPSIQAWRMAVKTKAGFQAAFAQAPKKIGVNPFRLFTGVTKQIAYQTFVYDTAQNLTLDFYPSPERGARPCVIVIHGGSWAGGDSQQLPELNTELAQAGYHVASIRYRLAPTHQFPAPNSDVQKAIAYLQGQASPLSLDSSRFVLLGRSAGGQIALSAAYTLNEPAIRGVINFYGPTDMVWGYQNPTAPLVLDSRKVMEDYLGETLQGAPERYLRSSATETVTALAPPTLMIFGENDPLVSHLHGRRLEAKLKAMGVPHYTLYLPWATHAFDYTLNGPAGQLSTWLVKEFLQVVLPPVPKN